MLEFAAIFGVVAICDAPIEAFSKLSHRVAFDCSAHSMSLTLKEYHIIARQPEKVNLIIAAIKHLNIHRVREVVQ